MDSFIQRQSVDLLRDNPILVRDQPIIKGDANALQWIVTVTKGGVPVDFTGATASLYCARAMLDDESGGTTWSSAATMANGTVTAVLPQDAANVAGPVGCTLRVTQNGASVTVARMAVMAIDPNGSDIVDVGNRIPNIDEVLAVVARCEEAANAANAAVSEIDNKIFSATEEKVDFDYGKNLINVNGNVKKGIYAFYSSGYCIENAEYQAIAVPVKGGEKVSFNQVFTNAHVVALSVIPDMTAVTAGDTLTGYIEGFADEARQGYVIPQKCKCLVVSIPINNASAAQCEYGEASTAYNPYVKGINASKIIGGILFVGDGYPYATIKDACDAAHDGDTIYIMPGTYKESVICYDKEVRIKGYSRDSVILTNDSGNYYASPLYIAKGAVEDLTIAETASEKDESAIAPAYCVHVDSDPQEGHSLTFKNVCFTNKVAACVGIGLRSNFKLSFQNCEFVSDEGYAVYLHESQYNGSKNQYAEFIDCIMQSNQAAHAICIQETPTVTDSEALVRFQRCIVKSASDEVITMVQYGTQPGLTGSGYLGSSVWKLDALSADNSASEMNALVFADVSKKADKVSGATDGNFAALDENGNLKDSGKNANDFAAVGEIDALKKSKAEIDDTAIDGDTWSSKHIADMLCPKVEKSGTLVQMDGLVEGYPLGVTVSWTPVQEGSGDPSPENIRPIKGRDSVRVERCGENLLNIKPFDTRIQKGVTFEYVPEGGIHIQGTASANADSPTFPVWHLPPGKYYGPNTPTGVSASIVIRRNGSNLWLNTKGIFEILAGDVTKYWYAIVANGTTLNNTIYPYIVPGTTAPTTYTPYIGRTNTLTLPETVYGGEVDAEGKGQETWGCIDSYAGETLPAEWICDRAAYAAGTTPPNGAQVAYKLDKPKPFTATGGTVIPALSGTNTVLTDADSVTVTGRADPIQTIAKLSNRIAALEAAATNITE